jgi:tetratricopeptide (TPR) repeat protein
VDFIADPLGRLGQLALQEGRLAEAYDLTIESIAAARAGGYDIVFSAWGDARLGLIQLYRGEVEAAQRSLEKALLFFEDDQSHLRPKQEALAIMSEVALVRGDLSAAADYMQASLNICAMLYRQLLATQTLTGTPDALPIDLIGLCARAALVAASLGKAERAVTLYSIADSLRSQSGQLMIPPLQSHLDESMAALHSHFSDTMFAIAWETGQKMSLSEAFAFLLN